MISDKFMKSITEALENRKDKMTTGGKIKRVIFKRDALSSFLIVIAMKSLNHIFRNCYEGYKYFKSEEQINHFIYKDDMKKFAKKWKRTGDCLTNKNILSA